MRSQLTEGQKKELQQKLQQKYQHYKDTRKESEIQLTNQLAHKYSQLNFERIENAPKASTSRKGIKKEDILYIYLHGVPPLQDQFKFLQLPGELISFKFTCFQKGKTEEQLKSQPAQFQKQAQILHDRINSISKDKPLIFIYHSYGTYTLAAYVHHFNTDRIIGIIDTGGAPIRMYPVIKQYIQNHQGFTLSIVEQELDSHFQLYNKANKSYRLALYNNKYQVLGVIRSFVSGFGFKQTFQVLRNLPKVLKCYLYGRKDALFPFDMVNQKVIYYSFTNKLDTQYQQKCKKAYERLYGVKIDNVQSRFIFSFQQGLHSIHMQRKFKDKVANIINHYLSFIEEVYAESQPKL